jgi:hypothetical protein
VDPEHLSSASWSTLKNAGNPDKQIRYHIPAICFVQHFVPAAWIEVVTNRGETCVAKT